ncbi:tyrosine-protein phosphatase [Streptomyces iconiensis]|uniref:Tyrosine-protein phosphatase n=1 Tax=Streptomyces iconiensis TaxID=1384038 RepID=A0ABT7A9V3_9ACTN|nr:tyrosine-protein phosphatase [Streptomyces iconiensis]MDJ1138111.1 tyrosine-protein phosphatase [Streptomyces iconiensis]
MAEGVVPFVSASVSDHRDGRYTVRWSAPGAERVRIYAEGGEGRKGGEEGAGGEGAGERVRQAVARGDGRGKVTVRVKGKVDRRWFRLVPDEGRELRLADRSLHLASAPNFRDAGGHRTADGRWVRMGKVYRSAGLDRLTAADRDRLKRLGIAPVLDLRATSEAKRQPDVLHKDADLRRLNVLGDGRTIANTPPTSARHARSLMLGSYRDFVTERTGRDAYRRLFADVTRPSGEAALYHCTAGKDRTGWASAALLTALGVPRSTVTRDYLASSAYLTGYNEQALHHLPASQHGAYKPMLAVRKEYLDSAFAAVRAEYGSFDGYLKKGLKLGAGQLAALRDELLVGKAAEPAGS